MNTIPTPEHLPPPCAGRRAVHVPLAVIVPAEPDVAELEAEADHADAMSKPDPYEMQ